MDGLRCRRSLFSGYEMEGLTAVGSHRTHDPAHTRVSGAMGETDKNLPLALLCLQLLAPGSSKPGIPFPVAEPGP